MRAYVGADWSAKRIVCATVCHGEVKPRFIAGAEANAESVAGLLARVVERHPGTTEVAVFIESGLEIWQRLLHAAGAVVYVLDAKQVNHFARSLGSSGAKDDKRDARVLAELGRSMDHRLHRYEPPSAAQEQLRALSRAHDATTQKLTKQYQQLRAHLLRAMPEVSRALPKLNTRWVRSFLGAAPTPWHAVAMANEDFERLCRRAKPASRDALWAAILRIQNPWMNAATAEVHALVIRQQLARIEALLADLAALETAIESVVDIREQRETLESVKGIALLQTTALLLHAFDEEPSHRDAAAVRMGAAPVFKGSAKTRTGKPKGHVTFRRSSPSQARRSAYLLGRLASQNLAWARAMYADGVSRGQKPPTVYRRIARSLLRILTAMLRTGEPYDDERYIARLKMNGVPWALSL